jgi:hypothetical protein
VRRSTRHIAPLVCAVASCVVATLSITLASEAAAARTPTSPMPTPPLITRSAHMGYLSCPAPDVLLTASIQRKPFTTGQLVTYRVSIRNLTSQVCGFRGGTLSTAVHAPTSGLLGLCGPIAVVIENARGVDVYPGPINYMCPAFLGPELGPGATITANGGWNQTARPLLGGRGPSANPPGGNTALLVPPGRYRLLVAGKVTLPIVLAAPTP